MNADRLLAYYEKIADAPDAIVRLRRFILDLAVRGKLVPQDPNDEPASELLKRIAADFERSVRDGLLNKAKPIKAITGRENLFRLPPRWKLARFNQVASIQSNLVEPMQHKTMPHIAPDNIEGWTSRLLPYVSIGEAGVFSSKHRFSAGAILYSKIRPNLAKVTKVDFDGLCSADMYPIQALIDPDFLVKFMITTAFVSQAVSEDNRVAMPKINQAALSNILVPVPPLAEQHRIVAKVDELMGLCDRLEAARAGREAVRDRLAAASLARLNAPDPETFQSDARFALDALPALTTRPDQIKALRQTILNLAVRGKLVPQDANDEPARLRPAECDERPAHIPSTWLYARLVKLLAEDTRNGYSRKPDEVPNGVPILRISAGTVRRDGVVAEEEHKLISGIDRESRLKYGLKIGDLLACRFNGNKAFVGRLTIFKDYLGLQPIYPDKLIRIRVSAALATPEFLRLAGDTDLVRAEVEAACATTVGNWGISASNLKEIRFPLPPLAEQHRIVAKVDTLMALCDRLEASLTAAADTRRRLLDALLAEALATAEDRELEAAA